jgi:hypothetical protein
MIKENKTTVSPDPTHSEEYHEWARYYLWRKFPDVQQVDTALQLSNGNLLPAFKQLTAAQAAAAGKKGKLVFGFGSTWHGSAVIVFPGSSVADPDPPDPHAFGPSGSTSQRYGSGSGSCSGSGSFYHHAKIVRKTLIPNILLLFLTFCL